MMTILFLALWLQMSAQPQIAANSYHFTKYVDCDLVLADGTAKNCKIKAGRTLDDVVNESAAIDRAINESQKDTGWSNEGNGGDGGHLRLLTQPRAADETDGKPGAHIYSIEELEAQGWKKSEISVCKYQVFADKRVELDGPDCPASVVREAMHPAEPVDVPAVQVGTRLGNNCASDVMCFDHQIPIYSCKDKSRILEHDENSPPKHWCRKVEF